MAGRRRPSFGAIVSNWGTYPAPAHAKLRLALKNAGLRFVKRSNCCGNHGQPGC
jgi:hypothetical protein